MFRTAIEPELRKMNREMVAFRKTQGRRVLGGIVSAAAAVAIGAYSGLPPLLSVPLVGAASIVGTRLLSKAAESLVNTVPRRSKRATFIFCCDLPMKPGPSGIEEDGTPDLKETILIAD